MLDYIIELLTILKALQSTESDTLIEALDEIEEKIIQHQIRPSQ